MVARLALLLSALALVAAACGDGGSADTIASLESDEPSVTTQPGEVDTEAKLFSFAACMREQGIDLPDPTVDLDGNVQFEPPDGFDPADTGELLEAAEQCDQFLEGLELGFDSIDLASITDTLLEFSTCMRDNGFELPDPDFSLVNPAAGSVPNAGPFGDVDFEDPDFIAAFGECSQFIANLGIGGQGG